MNATITKNGKFFLFLAAAGLLSLSACKKDKLPEIEPGVLSTVGVYVLNEGTYNQTTGVSPSSISYYNVVSQKVEIDYFKKVNNIPLGNNANDLKQYGSKIYCVITGTTTSAKDSYLEVINVSTGKSLKRIPFSDAAGGFMPRNIVFDKNKAYVSGYDGKLTKLDTASLNIESRVLVGGALEQLAIANNKIYVTNSMHTLFPSANNSSVSVVDIATFTKLKEITTGLNPRTISATTAGDLFVQTSGNYANVLGSIDRLSSASDIRLSTGSDLGLSFLSITGTTGFAIGYASTAPYAAFVKSFNGITGALENDLIKDNTVIKSPYAVTADQFEKTFYVADAKDYTNNGSISCFSAEGKVKFSFETGAVPKYAVFKYGY